MSLRNEKRIKEEMKIQHDIHLRVKQLLPEV